MREYEIENLFGRTSGSEPHWKEVNVNLATLGPKYKIKVWNPVPIPIELMMPKVSQ